MAERLPDIVTKIQNVQQLKAVFTAMRGIAASRAQNGRLVRREPEFGDQMDAAAAGDRKHRAGAHAGVETLGDDIGQAVVDDDFDLDVRITPEKSYKLRP
jgi:hypothetical protein